MGNCTPLFSFGVVVVGPEGDCRKRYIIRAGIRVDWREEENEERTQGYVVRHQYGSKPETRIIRLEPIEWKE